MVEVLHEGPPIITDRQRQVIELIADGCSNEEDAHRLGISPRTAKAHSDVLRQKLGCARRRQIPRAYRSLSGHAPPEARVRPPPAAPACAPLADRPLRAGEKPRGGSDRVRGMAARACGP